jgi:hypothetical protein
MDKVTEIKVERYFEELKDLGVEAKLELIKRLCGTLEEPSLQNEEESVKKPKDGK